MILNKYVMYPNIQLPSAGDDKITKYNKSMHEIIKGKQSNPIKFLRRSWFDFMSPIKLFSYSKSLLSPKITKSFSTENISDFFFQPPKKRTIFIFSFICKNKTFFAKYSQNNSSRFSGHGHH